MLKKEKNLEKIKELEDAKTLVETWEAPQFDAFILKHSIVSPDRNELSPCEKFNLMFRSQIGPTGKDEAFLRPETAQGMFLNFKRLLDYNHGKLPFGAAQIGNAFRNEIKPQQGLLRVREFPLAEIEYFIDPRDKTHPKFNAIKDTVVTLFPRNEQTSTRQTLSMSLAEAMEKKFIQNESLAYYIANTFLWLTSIGLDAKRIRFRQHLPGEMAHYACDCKICLKTQLVLNFLTFKKRLGCGNPHKLWMD